MFNNQSGKNEWSTINDEGELEFFIGVEAPRYNPEIESYTDYYFSTDQKIDTIVEDLKNEAQKDFNSINSVFNNIGDGIKNTSSILKYTPYLLLIGGAYFVYKKANYGS